jgi:hypothetical protein
VNKEIIIGSHPDSPDERIAFLIFRGRAENLRAARWVFGVLGANRYDAASSIAGLGRRVAILNTTRKLVPEE